jgi:hypothetical protein
MRRAKKGVKLPKINGRVQEFVDEFNLPDVEEFLALEMEDALSKIAEVGSEASVHRLKGVIVQEVCKWLNEELKTGISLVFDGGEFFTRIEDLTDRDIVSKRLPISVMDISVSTRKHDQKKARKTSEALRAMADSIDADLALYDEAGI